MSLCASRILPLRTCLMTSINKGLGLTCHPYQTQFSANLLQKLRGVSWIMQSFLRTNAREYNQPLVQEEVKDTREEDKAFTKETISLVNDQVAKGEEGRLFAVVQVMGKQFLITQEDIIIIHGYWPPTIGDQINFEKILLIGGSDFTLVGRPILPPDLGKVTATVIDKDLSHVKTKFRFRKRKQFRRINFIRSPLTMVRINEVKMVGKVNERKDVEGLDQVFY